LYDSLSTLRADVAAFDQSIGSQRSPASRG
jgi:hypothetical protein